jgi:hypothetical protein
MTRRWNWDDSDLIWLKLAALIRRSPTFTEADKVGRPVIGPMTCSASLQHV